MTIQSILFFKIGGPLLNSKAEFCARQEQLEKIG